MFGSNFSALSLIGSLSARCSPKIDHLVYWKLSIFFANARRKLFAADQVLEGLVHVERRGDELLGPHRAAVTQLDAGRLATLDDDALGVDLRLEASARGDEASPSARAPD